jgi:hypothetical protein
VFCAGCFRATLGLGLGEERGAVCGAVNINKMMSVVFQCSIPSGEYLLLRTRFVVE